MEGLGMKRLLIRLSAASGVVVAVLIAIAAAKSLGWGSKPEAVAAAQDGKPDKKVAAKVVAAAEEQDATSSAAEAPTLAAMRDPFPTAPAATEDRYAPENYYQDQEPTPAPADATYDEDTTSELMNAADDAIAAVENAAEAVAPADERYQPTDTGEAYEPASSEFDAEPIAAAASETPAEAPAEMTQAAPIEEQPADRYPTVPEENVAEATEDATQRWAPEESAAEEVVEATLASDPFARRASEEPAPRELPRREARAVAPAPVAAPADDYLEERYPTASAQSEVTEAPQEPPAKGARAPVRGAAEGAGVPGDPKLESEQGAALVIHKTGPPEVQLGLETIYEIRVQNVGDAPAHGVEVHDVAPRGADLVATQPQVQPGPNGELTWSLGTLAPGEEATVEMRVIPRAEGEIGSVARVVFAAEAAARTLVTKPVLELSIEAPKTVLAGERAQLFVRVTNTGTGVATGVTLEEVLPAGFEHPAGGTLEYRVGTLKPRDSRELPLTLSAKSPTESMNVVTARADGDIVVEQRTPISIVAPALQVQMQGPRRRFLDRDATYTVAISNPGTAPAHEIELVTFLAEGMEFVSADSAGQYDPQTRAVYWLLDELPPNEMGNVSVTARPTKPGEHILRVEGRAQRGLEAIEEQPITVEGLAAVEFQVIDLADPVEIAGEAAYEIVVKNGGTKDSSQIEVVATLPVEMQLIAAEGPTRFKAAGQKIMFEPLKSLAPGESVSYQLTAKTIEAGDARLQVKLITAEMQSPVTKEENTKVFGDE
jgi:uncharacterized repeat protein (TIGR01451 family)